MTCWNLQDGYKQYEIKNPSESSNNFPFFQENNYSLTSLICEGCGLWDQLMIAEGQNQWCTMQWTGRVDIHTCETQSSGLREASHWPKNCLRSNLIGSEFMTPDLLPVACLHTHFEPNLMACVLVEKQLSSDILKQCWFTQMVWAYLFCTFMFIWEIASYLAFEILTALLGLMDLQPKQWWNIEQVGSSQLAHLPWTTMGLFPVLLCITNTFSMTAMMAGGEVHRPSGVQQDIWNWVTLCSWPDCRRRCREIVHVALI